MRKVIFERTLFTLQILINDVVEYCVHTIGVAFNVNSCKIRAISHSFIFDNWDVLNGALCHFSCDDSQSHLYLIWLHFLFLKNPFFHLLFLILFHILNICEFNTIVPSWDISQKIRDLTKAKSYWIFFTVRHQYNVVISLIWIFILTLFDVSNSI